MKLTRSLYLYLGIIAISLSIIGYTLYYFYEQLGGFEKLEVVELGAINRTVAGMSYRGKAQTKAYDDIINKCADQILNKKLDGTLTVITYKNDTLESNEVDLFIGITLNSSMSEIPYDFEIKNLRAELRYAVLLTMHPMVRPSVERVENVLTEQAKEDGKELRPMFMELYYDDDSMTIEAWTK